MKPKTLLTGRTGQIGAELLRLLPRLVEVIAPDRGELDLLKPGDIRRTIREVRPRLIVNAAGYTAVDRAETDEVTARAINAEAPALMAREARLAGAAFLHYSTDYVFDGLKKTPYEETDPPSPVNIYGKTKLEGEQAVRESGVPHLIIRTAWVYGARGQNFLLTILRLATQRQELRVVNDQIGAPTWSREIAGATSSILAKLLASEERLDSLAELGGTYHLTAAGNTTWYEFAQTILEEASRISSSVSWFRTATGGQPLIARRVIPVSTREYPTPAARPAYSVLSNSRVARAFGCELADWRAQLQDLFSPKRSGRRRKF
jgi:dTDP-4-dehydrorhamnose reductase